MFLSFLSLVLSLNAKPLFLFVFLIDVTVLSWSRKTPLYFSIFMKLVYAYPWVVCMHSTQMNEVIISKYIFGNFFGKI